MEYSRFELFLFTFFEEFHQYIDCLHICRLVSTLKHISNVIASVTSDGLGKPRCVFLSYKNHVNIVKMLEWLARYRFVVHSISFSCENDLIDYFMIPREIRNEIPGDNISLCYNGPPCQTPIMAISQSAAVAWAGKNIHQVSNLIDRNVAGYIDDVVFNCLQFNLRIVVTGNWMLFERMACLELAIIGSGHGSTINPEAFRYCRKLRKCEIPDGVDIIDYRAFSGCQSLANIIIPDSVKSIHHSAFSDCRALREVSLGQNLSRIDAEAFMECVSLTFISLPDSLCVIDFRAFEGCVLLEGICFGCGLLHINDRAFHGCVALKCIVLPDGLKVIGNQAFSQCKALETITIGKGLEIIGRGAFEGCTYLYRFIIQDDVIPLCFKHFLMSGSRLFRDCYELRNVMICGKVYVVSVDGNLEEGSGEDS